MFDNSFGGSSHEVGGGRKASCGDGNGRGNCFIFLNLMLWWTMRCDGQYCLNLNSNLD